MMVECAMCAPEILARDTVHTQHVSLKTLSMLVIRNEGQTVHGSLFVSRIPLFLLMQALI